MALFDIISTVLQNDAAGDVADAKIQGQREAFDIFDSGFQQTQSAFEPFVEGGVNSNNLLLTALGVNGLEEQQGFFNNFQNFCFLIRR